MYVAIIYNEMDMLQFVCTLLDQCLYLHIILISNICLNIVNIVCSFCVITLELAVTIETLVK